MKRVFLIVLDSFGIGTAPDSADFGDAGADTLGSIRRSAKFSAENMKKLGLFNIDGIAGGIEAPVGAYARMTERSRGKDTIIGHWEMCGVISESPMPTFPDGFPEELLEKLSAAWGRGILCNKPYSGTQVIADYGREHIETGKLIVYTSADSVLQIAAHESVVPIEELYRDCEIARGICQGKYGVGRIIARPFEGEYPFKRTTRRHDFALVPPHKTTLDLLKDAGLDVIAVGKISDIFAGQGVTDAIKTAGNADGMEKTMALLDRDFRGFAFVNLVDFDMVYGHRRDIDGYAAATAAFDAWLGDFRAKMRPDDLLLITGDHGCDPGFTGTDHTREYTPLLAAGDAVRPGNLGTRMTFADIGATVADIFCVPNPNAGESMKEALLG